LPPDDILKSFLLDERRFNEHSVDDLIRSYKATLAFAGLWKRGGTPVGESPDSREQTLKDPLDLALTASFPLLAGNRVEFRVLQKIDPEEAQQLRVLFEVWLEKISQDS
jgi:hypothetical protein